MKAARASKKLKYMDDPLVAEKAHTIALRDKWLIKKGNPPPDTKARMKKAADAEKKLAEKQTKAQEKAKAKNLRPSEMMRLAINNRQAKEEIESFRAILSDLITDERSEDDSIPLSATPFNSTALLGLANSSRQTIQQKKVASAQSKVARLNRQSGWGQAAQQARSLTPPPPAQMELIQPGKYKV